MEKILWTSTSPTEARANAWTQPRSQSPSLLSRRMFRVPRGWRAGQERGGRGTCSPGWPPETGRSLTPGFKLPPRRQQARHQPGPAMAMRYRQLARNASGIHGWGLFCKREISAGEMVSLVSMTCFCYSKIQKN